VSGQLQKCMIFLAHVDIGSVAKNLKKPSRLLSLIHVHKDWPVESC
jgi:hypothetical protein